MKLLLVLSLTVCGAAVGQAANQLTQSELKKVETSLIKMLNERDSNGPQVVRLIFHDCVGGCDGCINVTAPANGGLERIVDDLENVYQRVGKKVLSRADVWALAGKLAVERASRDAEMPEIEFKYGRKDCSAFGFKSSQTRNLATIDLNSTGVTAYFFKEFDFTPRESVAIMGAHTLGGAHKDISGRSGMWVKSGPLEFDNKYYSNMIEDTTWKRLHFAEKGLQWKVLQWNGKTGFRLNSDLALYKDIEVDSNRINKRSCNYHSCGLADTADIVQEYGKSNPAFIRDFGLAFTKMINNKVKNLRSCRI